MQKQHVGVFANPVVFVKGAGLGELAQDIPGGCRWLVQDSKGGARGWREREPDRLGCSL